MTEFAHIEPDYIKDLRTPEELLEETLNGMISEGSELAAHRFSDPQDVRQAFGQYLIKHSDALSALPSASAIEMQFSGEGVKVPNIEVAESTGSDRVGISVTVPANEAYTGVPRGQVRRGEALGLFGSTVSTPEGYQVVPYLTFRSTTSREDSLNLTPDMSIFELKVAWQGLASLDGRSRLAITSLEQIREVYRAEEELKRYAELDRSDFNKEVNRLRGALIQNDPNVFVPMKNPQIIRRLGSLGSEITRKGDPYASIAKDRLLSVLGRERKLEIVFEDESSIEGISADRVITGRVQDVIMPTSESDPIDPMLLLKSVTEESEDQRIVPVPLDKVKEMAF